jgi:hypothetical protein
MTLLAFCQPLQHDQRNAPLKISLVLLYQTSPLEHANTTPKSLSGFKPSKAQPQKNQASE